MEPLLKRKTVRMTGNSMKKQEECPLSAEYTLPDYCQDIAVVLKCFAYPHIQNRQWSGDQFLLDGNAVIRVLYLDEDRQHVHSLEFTQPFSCTLKGEGRVENAAVNIDMWCKYLNCRALGPRRVEVRGAIAVVAFADCVAHKDLAMATDENGLYSCTDVRDVTLPCGISDKVVTISESLDFHESLPPAEMLLGGECRAVIRECKVLNRKAILKGQVYLHQLYRDSLDGNGTHCLDYELPFSQIMDVDEAAEGMPYSAFVHVLSDTERCSVGPDGENTILDVSVKLLVQVQVYCQEKISVLRDAYHCSYPIVAQTEEVELRSVLGSRWEETVLPMQLALTATPWNEIIDICIQSQECVAEVRDDRIEIEGRMNVCVVARDGDGEVVYSEFAEDYGLEFACMGNQADVRVIPTTLKYRVAENKLELQVSLCVAITEMRCEKIQIVSDMRLQLDAPYPKQKATTLLYYADAGEHVWDIGRRCRTSPACIVEENELAEEMLCESKVLVVPIVN